MRILIHSNFPGAPTGYGKQAGLLAEWLAGQGHQVACSAFYGHHAGPTTWRDIPVYPGGRQDFGMDVLPGYYRHWKADALITLMDTWRIDPDALSGRHLKMAFITPIDCEPLGAPDEAVLRRTHALPLAISQHGMRMLQEAFFKPRYTPHGIDTAVFAPPPDRAALRARMGVSGRFVIGINAANREESRKAFDEQFQAFALFAKKHPDALLRVHAPVQNMWYGGLSLWDIAVRRGIDKNVEFADEDAVVGGLVGDEDLAEWYGSLDLLTACSRGEGFGLPIVEAQACGTPVVVTRASSMPELCGAGWVVGGQRLWRELHHADWVTPDVGEIAGAYEKAYRSAGRKRARAREFALGYDVKRVMEKYWPPVLEALG